MELSRIIIKNFRSIKEATITFDHNCLILLGKNEAGKSNILKAIAAVFGEYEVSQKDRRKKIDNESIKEYKILAAFKLDKKDIKEIETRLKNKFTNTELIKFKSKKSVSSFISTFFKELVLSIEINDDKTPFESYWIIAPSELELEKPLFLSSNIIEETGKIEFNFEKVIFTIIKEYYNENVFNCHYWQYSDDYLLPNSVSINTFISNPSKYKALENIFALCNRSNIKAEFEEAMAQDGDYSNLLEQVSKTVTSTFQKIWKDFKGTAIKLEPNGTEILVKVVNKAKYSFEDRSEGFKKFISILLMLSTQSRANRISENDIILIDEPDQSLYPTSAQHLRDELLEISKKSKVVYATHSQYMIDSECLDRHIIVEKNDDITVLTKETSNAQFANDELLRRAIGSSIFECLKPQNLIFEGWLDKELFNKYCSFEKKQKDFSKYGTVYLSGISGTDALVQLLILANKKFVIIADSDETSKNKRNEFVKNYPEYKDCWLAYADIVADASTMEDFIETSHIEDYIQQNIHSGFVYDNTKNAIINIEKAVNKDKEKKQEVKKLLIETIAKEKIKSNYALYIEALKQKLI